MLTQQQLANEKRKEAEYNKLFEQVIAYSPFGQWYPLMQNASDILRQNLPKRVGIDKDGRPLVVYKGEIPKILGVWSEPTHQVVARDLSHGDWGKALGDFFGTGHIKESVRQQKAKFFDISPAEVAQVYQRKQEEASKKSWGEPKKGETKSPTTVQTTEKKSSAWGWIAGIGITTVLIIGAVKIYKGK